MIRECPITGNLVIGYVTSDDESFEAEDHQAEQGVNDADGEPEKVTYATSSSSEESDNQNEEVDDSKTEECAAEEPVAPEPPVIPAVGNTISKIAEEPENNEDNSEQNEETSQNTVRSRKVARPNLLHYKRRSSSTQGQITPNPELMVEVMDPEGCTSPPEIDDMESKKISSATLVGRSSAASGFL